MRIIRTLLGNTKLYKIASWLYAKYLNDQSRIYSPEQFKEFGKGAKIHPDVYINMPEKVVLKDRVEIFSGTIINSNGGLYVGENTGIGYNCTIFTSQHHYRGAKSIPFDNISELKPVIIREYVWIGAGVMIMPGMEIGEGAILGMGSVITKNVPPLAIVIGNPAQIVMYRDKAHFYECKASGKFQTISIGHYERVLIPMFEARYRKELEELGMM